SKYAPLSSELISEYNKNGEFALLFDNLKFTKSAEESQELNKVSGGIMIISASGMCDAGRIKHHLKHNLWRENATVLITGYQAEGTLGRRLIEGEKIVRIHGDSVMVKAEIIKLEGFSGHIDNPGILEWLSSLKKKPIKTFIIHGEEDQQLGLEKSIKENFGFDTYIPALREMVNLTNAEVKGLDSEKYKRLRANITEEYFAQYKAIKQNLKELMKLRLNQNQVSELYDDLKTLEKVSRKFLVK
ncbi:MAG TPA: MBL fold metallo-hydrolase, partial [bacterium]|nr:MBL fold metallo-hydrolase [bacterium]